MIVFKSEKILEKPFGEINGRFMSQERKGNKERSRVSWRHRCMVKSGLYRCHDPECKLGLSTIKESVAHTVARQVHYNLTGTLNLLDLGYLYLSL
jgi:hypothetical protein